MDATVLCVGTVDDTDGADNACLWLSSSLLARYKLIPGTPSPLGTTHTHVAAATGHINLSFADV